jgi:hypothetical protein
MTKIFSQVRTILYNLANHIVPLTEKSIPLIKRLLSRIIKILPLWTTVFLLQRRLSQGTGGIFAREYYRKRYQRDDKDTFLVAREIDSVRCASFLEVVIQLYLPR